MPERRGMVLGLWERRRTLSSRRHFFRFNLKHGEEIQMSDPLKNKSAARRTNPRPIRSRISKKEKEEAKEAGRARYRMSTSPPATPLVLPVRQAWERLCAQTGASVDLSAFYRWIGNLSVYSVRMGNKIFIPIAEVERLTEQCLRGERL
jgi:hypothetical protein